eukprot:COSAG04_NODE_4995_length_1787_cov_1.034360_1_plen_419_part_00
MANITTMKPPHRCDHPVLPSYAARTWANRSMENMASYDPQGWHPSGEAERIRPQRNVFRQSRVLRPHTPDALSLQLAHTRPVSLEETLGRPEWVHSSNNPNLMARTEKKPQGLTNARLRELKHKLQAAAYGRGDVGDTSDDWEELFKLYDADGGGTLDFDEFKQVVRKHGRISVRDINDIELRQVFDLIDEDGSDEIDGVEFSEWLLTPIAEEGTPKKPKKKAKGSKRTSTADMIKAMNASSAKRLSSASESELPVRALPRTNTRYSDMEERHHAPTYEEAHQMAQAFTQTSKALAEVRFGTPEFSTRPTIIPSRKKGVVREGCAPLTSRLNLNLRKLSGDRLAAGCRCLGSGTSAATKRFLVRSRRCRRQNESGTSGAPGWRRTCRSRSGRGRATGAGEIPPQFCAVVHCVRIRFVA